MAIPLRRPDARSEYYREMVLVAPETASRWLAASPGNRSTSKGTVSKYARMMGAGRWYITGTDAICFDTNGHLINGHHRLLAVIESGAHVWMEVARNVPAEARDVIDSGKARSFADRKQFEGERIPHLLAAVARWLYRYDHNDMKSSAPVADMELDDSIRRHPMVRGAVARIDDSRAPLIRNAPIAFVLTLAMEKDEQAADEWVSGLRTGLGFNSPDDPTYVLHKRLQQNRTAKQKERPITIAAFAVKSWNARRLGKPLRILKWNTDVEDFPVIA